MSEIEAYAIHSNNALIHLRSHGIKLIYDGHHVILFLSNYYRNNVRGLCGTFGGEPVNDLTTSSNCVLKNHTEFAASFAMIDDGCRGPAKELYSYAKNVPCYPIETTFVDVITDAEAGRYTGSNNNSIAETEPKGCSVFRVSTFQDSGRTCFSLRTQITCRTHCKAPRTARKTVDFLCLKDSVVTKRWLAMSKRGMFPNFNQNKPNHQETVMLPEKCIPQ